MSTQQLTTAGFAPLEGIRVLDFSHVIAGPFATFHLAQLGADVLKVEHPGGGDVMRHNDRGLRGFVALNAGKRFASIDLATDAGRGEALALAAGVDIVVDNLRPGVLDKHGVGWDTVRTINPRAIYCSISGFGRSSPAWYGRPAYDHVVQAATGMAMMGGSEGDGPVKTGFPVIDAAAGMLAAMAILAALRERDRRGGTGMLLDVSMAAAALQLMYTMTCEAMTTGTNPARVGNQGYSGSPAADMFHTRDGWIALGANTATQLRKLLNLLGIAEQARDEGLVADVAGFARATDPGRLKALIAERVADRSAADIEQQCATLGIPAARVRTLAEFVGEAAAAGQIQTQQLVGEGAEVTSPGLGFRVGD
jgi:crotonobetainyl-CoA:carnitine CoA-transferase CaiB-like acyl-CoA transferase